MPNGLADVHKITFLPIFNFIGGSDRLSLLKSAGCRFLNRQSGIRVARRARRRSQP